MFFMSDMSVECDGELNGTKALMVAGLEAFHALPDRLSDPLMYETSSVGRPAHI